jgi:hypothetical protein
MGADQQGKVVNSDNVYPEGWAPMFAQPSSHSKIQEAIGLLAEARLFASFGEHGTASQLERAAMEAAAEATKLARSEDFWCAVLTFAACVAIVVAAGLVGVWS